MTISTTQNRISYNGNGVTTAFSFPYRFFQDADLVVILVASDGTETTKVLNTDYTVTGEDTDSSGQVTMVVAPATGQRLVIYRSVTATQETDYITGDQFPAETHERALDKLTILSQQNDDALDRALILSPTTPTAVSGALPAPVASTVIGWDTDGETLKLYEVSDITILPADVLRDADIGVSVQAYDATILNAADIGVSVQAYDATILNAADIGVSVQAYDADTAKTDADQSWTGSPRATPVTDNDGSFDMNAGLDFLCTPTAGFTLTFTNITQGQRGCIYLVNGSNYTIAAAATTKVTSTLLASISATGEYWLSYWSPDGTNVLVAHAGDFA